MRFGTESDGHIQGLNLQIEFRRSAMTLLGPGGEAGKAAGSRQGWADSRATLDKWLSGFF